MTGQKDKMFSQADRDLLITLNAKFDNLSRDVKVVSESLKSRMSSVEARVAVIEREHIEVPPKDTYNRFVKVEEGYKRVKWFMWLIGFIAIMISWTTGFLNQVLTLFNNGR